MRLVPDRIGVKLNVSVLLFLLLLAGATALLVYAGFERTQREATDSSKRGLEGQGRDALASLAQFNAAFGQAQLEATAGLAQQAARYMSDGAVRAKAPDVDEESLVRAPNGILFDGDPARRTDVVLPAFATVNDAALRDIRDSSVLEDLFPALLSGFSGETRNPDFDAVAIYFDGINNVTRMYPPFPDINALPGDADVRTTLERVGPAQNPERATVWTPPYEDAAGRGLTLTAMVPVYTGDEFRGAISVDLSLTRLLAQVDQARPTPGGYAFYIDRDGNLLPTSSAPIVQAAIDDTSNEAFAATLAAIRGGETGVDAGVLQRRDVFIAYAPLAGIGGSLALVAPVDEVTAQAEAVAASIEDEENRTVAITLAVMAGFFVAALAGSALLSRQLILRPIESIVRGTRSVAAGDLDSRIAVQSGDELGVLAESFNDMTSELASSRSKLDAQREQIRESESELRALFAAMTDVVFVISDEGEYLRAAPTIPALSQSYRNRTAALIGRHMTDVLEPRVAEDGLAAIRSSLDGGETQSFEYRVEFDDGDSRWFNALVSPMTASTVLWVARDVTRRKRDEQLIAEREQQYRSLFEAATDALFITDLEDHIIDANPAACEMHGYTLEEMLALPPFTLVHKEFRPRTGDYLGEVAAGRPVRTRVKNVRKDGSVFPVDVLGTPITFRSEPHVLVVVRDITEQVESERLLEQRVADRTREVASLLDVARSVASSLETDRLVEIILNEIQSLAGYTTVSVLTVEGNKFTVRNWHSDASVDAGPEPVLMRFPEETTAPYMALLKRGRPLIIDDVRDDSEPAKAYRAIVGDVFNTPLFAHARSLMIVPMITKDRLIGALSLTHREPGFYTQQRALPVVGIAAQAAVAIDNARLFELVQGRAREMSALLHVSQAVVSSLDLNAVARAILEELAHVADYSGATLAAIEGDDLVVLDSWGPFREEVLKGPTARIPIRGVSRSLWQALKTGEPIVIDDTADDTEASTMYRRIFAPFLELPSFAHIRSWLAVPLMRQGEIIGMLTASHEDVRHFTPNTASLVAAAANQTAVALENARLFEQAEERTRELETLLDVSRNVASTLELQPLLRLVLEQVAVVADYDRASVLTLDGNELRVLCVIDKQGTADAGARLGAEFGVAPASDLWAALSSGQVVLIDDVRGDSDMACCYRQDVAPQVDPELQWVRAWMAAPLMLHERIVGMFALTSETPGAFNERQGALVQAIGAQAAVAIENARLYEESQQRSRETEALLRADEELFRSLDLDDVLGALVDVTIDVMRADKCVLTLFEGGEERVRAARNFSEQGLVQLSQQAGERSRSGITPPKRPFVLNDISEERRPNARAIWEAEGIRSYMALPIHAGGQLIGGFGVAYTSPHMFGEGERRVFQALAERGGAAIQNADLYEKAQRAASLEERQRLARELHDSVSQALYGIALGARTARTQLDRDPARAVEPVDYVLSLAEAGLAEMRALIFELRPESLELEGLVAGLEKQAAALRARHGIEVDAELCDEPDAPLAIKEAVSRIAQEAMHNTVKHARASRVSLRLALGEGRVELEVQDDGRGFDPSQPYAGHLGLRSMRERAEKLGGTIDLESRPGHGARIRVSIPLPAPAV